MERSSMSEGRGPVVAGIDTHKKEHALCLLDGWGRKVFEGFFPADESGYAAMAEEIGEPKDCIVVGVECTMSYGAGLCRHLVKKGFRVVEVLHPEKKKRGRGSNKNDLEDAERAARTAVAEKYTSTPKAGDGWVEATRSLMVARKLAVKTSTSAVNAVKALLTSAPERIRAKYSSMGVESMMATLSRKRTKDGTVEESLYAALRSLACMWIESRKQADDAESRIKALVEENAPALIALDGCGALTAATLAIAAGDNPGRMGSKDSFAALCGTSPIEASSGDVKRHRLNQGGNRQANCALHQIVLSRMKHDERTKAYVEKRKAQGKSKREIMRCLKRYVANEAYKALMSPMSVPESQGSRLRELRTSLGLSQADVASMLLVSRAKISEIECGKKRCLRLEGQYCRIIEKLTDEHRQAGQQVA